MKTPFKSVLATLVALFLSISLSGCFEEGAKTASQGDAVSSSVSDSGKVKLVLKPGTNYIRMEFSTKDFAEEQGATIRSALQANGITVDRVVASGDRSIGILIVAVGPIRKKVDLFFTKDNLHSFEVKSVFNEGIARWEPSYGDEVKYSG
jgi:uncharacterized membrane protein